MDIEIKIEKIEEEISSLKNEVNELVVTRPFLEELIKRNTITNEKLVETLHEVEKSMVSMNDKMEAQTQVINSMREDIDNNNKQVNERISNVKKQIDKVDEEGKFNIRTFIRSYLPWIIVVLGAGILFVTKFVKF